MRRGALAIAFAAIVAGAGFACGDDPADEPRAYEPPPRRAPPPAPEPEAAPKTVSIDAGEPNEELSPRECVAACRRRNMARAVGADQIDEDCYGECEARCERRCVERAKRRGDPSETIDKDCTAGCKIRRGI